MTVVQGLTALHALMRSERAVRADTLSKTVKVSKKSLRPILNRLAEAGLVAHQPRRGFTLAKAPGEIRLEEVISALDSACRPSGPCGGDFEACPSRASCVLSILCRKADEQFTETVRTFTLDQLKEATPDLPNCLDPKLRRRARA